MLLLVTHPKFQQRRNVKFLRSQRMEITNLVLMHIIFQAWKIILSLGQFLEKDCYLLILYFVYPQFACWTPKIPKKKKASFLKGIVGTPRSSWFNLLGLRSVQSTILGQNDQNAPGQPGVDQKSKLVKKSTKMMFFMFLYQTWEYRSLLLTLTKFDIELTFWWQLRVDFWPDRMIGIKPTLSWRILNSLQNDSSWVEIRIKTIEISWK